MESPVQCGCNAHAAPGFFSLAGTAVKAARCRRQRSMGIGEFPQQAENRFRVTKALLATFVRKQYPYPLHDDLLLLS